MRFDLLDNPGWHALNSHHRHLAIWGELSARYHPDILGGAAMPEYDSSGFYDLGRLVNVHETIGFLGGTVPEDLDGWQVLHDGYIPQMVCEELKPANPSGAVKLTADDVPEMLDLVTQAQPGPFLPRTIEMGQYFGIRQDGKLVAMAGERLHLEGFCEISAVCTHPDYRGRGYASALTTMVAEKIITRGERPFLHLAPTNDIALKLYTKLGFRLRQEIKLAWLERLA